MAKETHQLIEKILALHQRLYVALRSPMAEHWMSADYTMPQLKVLLYLYTDGPSRMTGLASALRVTLPSVTGIIERLVEKGLVLRDQEPGDRRVVICHLSSEGDRQISGLWAASFDMLRRVLLRVPSEELGIIARGAQLMLNAAEQSIEKPMDMEAPHATRV